MNSFSTNGLGWYLLAAIICFAVSFALVKLLIARSHQAGLIDTPNERSSHTVPTPRGGGVAFVITFLLASFPLGFAHWWLIPTCAAVAVLGFLDDRFSLRASRRLLVQALAAVISVSLLLWNLPADSVYKTETTLSLIGGAFALFSFFWIVWMTNLYNFLDGIDGYAAMEAVIVSLALALLAHSRGLDESATTLAIVGSSVAGFLVLNWSPAKIFMGDAGSTFLGFFFAVFAVHLHLKGIPIEVSIILLGTFIADATYTLFVRLFSGKKVHLAHRDHAYQHAVQKGWSHAKTVLILSAVTIFWLLPIAIAAMHASAWLPRAGLVILAYLPLLGIQVYFKAGIERK